MVSAQAARRRSRAGSAAALMDLHLGRGFAMAGWGFACAGRLRWAQLAGVYRGCGLFISVRGACV